MIFYLFFILYQLLQITFLPIVVPYTFIKAENINIAQEKLGIVPTTEKSEHVIWIHGLNAGEILSVQALIEKIKIDIPGSRCYITSSTQEGKTIAQKILNADYTSMLPQDNLASMALAFERINPSSIIVLEHDVWPTMITYAHMKNIPIYLLNAQMTSCTAKNLQNHTSFYRDLFNTFTTIFTQSEFDKKLFKEAGIFENNIITLGNIKAFNVIPKKSLLLKSSKAHLEQFKKNKTSTILLVGSVHRGEIDYYLKAFSTLKKSDPSLKIIFVPRFNDWNEELINKVKKIQMSYFIWTNNSLKIDTLEDLITQLGEKVLRDHDIVIVDKFGVLFMLSSLADLYFPGGTFVPVGGHNVLEAAVWANAMIIGPHDENTREIVTQLAQNKGIIQVSTYDELLDQTKELISNRAKCKQLGLQASNWIKHQAIYVKAGLERIVGLLNQHICSMTTKVFLN